MQFEIIGPITDVQTIAVGSAIREVPRLRKAYGSGRWRKLKGLATIRLSEMVPPVGRSYIGMRPTGLVARKSKSNACYTNEYG